MIVVMVVMMLRSLFFGESDKIVVILAALLHGFQDDRRIQLLNRRRDNGGVRVDRPDHPHDLFDLLLGRLGRIGAAQHDRAGELQLVVEEFTEILDIKLALGDVRHRREAVENDIIGVHILDGLDDVRQLADARRLDDDAVRMVSVDNFLKRLAEIADKRAADATAVHLADLDPGLL